MRKRNRRRSEWRRLLSIGRVSFSSTDNEYFPVTGTACVAAVRTIQCGSRVLHVSVRLPGLVIFAALSCAWTYGDIDGASETSSPCRRWSMPVYRRPGSATAVRPLPDSDGAVSGLRFFAAVRSLRILLIPAFGRDPTRIRLFAVPASRPPPGSKSSPMLRNGGSHPGVRLPMGLRLAASCSRG